MSTMKPKSGPLANISYNTNNPVLADSRVFVGNLRTEIVTQEQLHKIFKRFGPITGLSIHKGYGFVQFTNEKNARSAVDGTHGTEVGGQKIDCRIASEGASRNKSKKSLDPRSDKGYNNNHGLSGSGHPYSTYISPASLTPEIVRNHVLTCLHSNPTDQTLEDFESAFQTMFNYSLSYHGMTQLGFNNVQEYMMHEFGNFIRVWLDASNSVFLKLDGPIPQPEKPVAAPLPTATQYPSIATGGQSWGGNLSVQQQIVDDVSSKSASSVVPTQALAATIGLSAASANTASSDQHPLASNSNNYPLSASQQLNESVDKPILSYFEFRKIEFKREIICRVYLAHCENPSNLVVQICGEEFSSSLDELNQQMSALYSEEDRKSVYEVPESFFSIGQCCVAKYESLHYRATILSVTPSLRKCTVLYVDYGNEDQVDFDDILALHEDFMILPMQAIQVSLANLAPIGPTLIWVGEAKNEIDDYQDIILECNLVHVDSRQLFVQLSHEGESLSERLLKNNIAKKQDINYGESSTISHFPPCSRYQKLDFAIKSSRPESRHMFASPSVEKPYLTASPGAGNHFAGLPSKFSPNRGSSEGLSAGRTVALPGGKISPSPKISTTPSKMTPGGGDSLGNQFVHPNTASSNRGGPQLPPTYLIPSSCFQTNVAVISPAASTVNATCGSTGGVFSGLNGPTAVSATGGASLSAGLSRMAPTYQQMPPAPTQLPKPCPPLDPKWEGSKISRYCINDPVSGKLFVHVVSSSQYEGIYISLVERMKLTGETAQYLLSNQHCILVHRTFENLYSEMRSLNLLYNSEIILCDLDRTYLALNAISTKIIDNDLLDGLFDIILRASQPIKMAPRVW